jgi:DUF1009 family protein
MKLKELIEIMSCKDGDELLVKIARILDQYGIDVLNSDESVKDLQTLCWEVVEVLNKEK